MMGGKLSLAGTPGLGTTFSFDCIFKSGAASPVPLPVEGQTSKPQRSLRILVAEDNAVNQKVIMRMLQKANHAVTLAANGADAISLWKENFFDVVILDIEMPVMNGVQAAVEIRRLEAHASRAPTPLVALTAHALDGDREKYLALGMSFYVTKPIDRGLLLDILASIPCLAGE